MRKMLTQLYFYVMPVFNVDGYRFSWTNVSNGTGIIQKIIHTKKKSSGYNTIQRWLYKSLCALRNGSKLLLLKQNIEYFSRVALLCVQIAFCQNRVILLFKYFVTYARIDFGGKQDQRTWGFTVMVLMLIATGKWNGVVSMEILWYPSSDYPVFNYPTEVIIQVG